MAVEVEWDGEGLATITLNRPPVNALDVELVDGLATRFAEVLEVGARAIVLTGSGRCFSAGIDTKMAATLDAPGRRAAHDSINAMVRRVASAPVPVLAAVNGHAFGGGLVTALACDVRLGARGGHRLALNEAAAGVPFPEGPLEIVRDAVDPSVLRDLCLTCRELNPEQALELRVLDELHEPDELLERARRRALELAAFPAYAEVKAQVRRPGPQGAAGPPSVRAASP